MRNPFSYLHVMLFRITDHNLEEWQLIHNASPEFSNRQLLFYAYSYKLCPEIFLALFNGSHYELLRNIFIIWQCSVIAAFWLCYRWITGILQRIPNEYKLFIVHHTHSVHITNRKYKGMWEMLYWKVQNTKIRVIIYLDICSTYVSTKMEW